MSNFTKFHEDAWETAIAFSQKTGCLIVVDTNDPLILNKYVAKFNHNGFTYPQRVVTNPPRNRFMLFAPKTVDRLFMAKSTHERRQILEFQQIAPIMAALKKSRLGRLALWWVMRKLRKIKPTDNSEITDIALMGSDKGESL